MRASRLETCRYISDQVAELAKLAINASLPDLAFLLSMAQLEANNSTIAAMEKAKLQKSKQSDKKNGHTIELAASAP